MIHLLGKLPRKIGIAVSGGPDSMACLDFLSRQHDVTAIFFNHGTQCSNDSEKIVKDFCQKKDIYLSVGTISRPKNKKESDELYWRDERYKYFDTFNIPIITCHHLDDIAEWWIFTSLHGDPKLIPYERGKYLRPFLTNRKNTFLDWCKRKNIEYYNDPSNRNPIYRRSYIRYDVIPSLLKINPGLHKVLKRKVIESFENL
tara:strand:+ start:677 stop:1279 length:603 start_codon:yes stop_codon:yes gene_type:complete